MAVEANDQTLRRVFISYDHRDEAEARKLRDRLLADGFDVWRDKENIRLGARFTDELTKAIQTAQFFIACVSANYCEKLRDKGGILRQELQAGLKIQHNSRLRTSFHRLLPLRQDESQLPAEFDDRQYLDWDSGVGYSRLVEEMRQAVADWEGFRIRNDRRKRRIKPAIPRLAMPPLTRILFADTQELLSENRLPLVVNETTPSGLSGIIELRNWTWQHSALGRWRAAGYQKVLEELRGGGTLNCDLLIFSWLPNNNDVAQSLYELTRVLYPELPLLLVADDDGTFKNRNDRIRGNNHLFTLFQPPDDWEGSYPDRHAPFRRSNFLNAFKALDDKFLPEAQARLTNHNDLHIRRLCNWLGGEEELQLTVQKFFPQAREFRLSEVEGLGAESEIWRLQVEGLERRYLLAFFEKKNDYERALLRHKPATEWLGVGAARLHLIPELAFDDQREAFPGEKPVPYALCYEIDSLRRKTRTFVSFYRHSHEDELGVMFSEMLKRLRSKPRGDLNEAPWHEPDKHGNCPHGFCWKPDLRGQLLIALRDLEPYGPALYESLRQTAAEPEGMTWEKCKNELETLVYKPLPSWLTDPYLVRHGHIHGQPTVDRWLESTAGKLQLIDFGHYDDHGRLVTDLAIMERDLKLRLLSTESGADGFGELQIAYLPLWCGAESAAIAGLLDFRHDQSGHHPTINRTYQLIVQVRAEAKRVCAKQDVHGSHYFAALLYWTLKLLSSSSVRPTKKLLALHSAAEILRTFARLFPHQ